MNAIEQEARDDLRKSIAAMKASQATADIEDYPEMLKTIVKNYDNNSYMLGFLDVLIDAQQYLPTGLLAELSLLRKIIKDRRMQNETTLSI